MTVDIITPVFNGADYIEEAIKSILNQTWARFNYILINDGSTDQTQEIIEHYSRIDERISLFNYENNGPSSSVNRGIEKIKAKYVAFLDHDDLWHKKKLELQINYMIHHPEVGYTFTMMKEFQNNEQNNIYKARKQKIIGAIKSSFLGKSSLFRTYGKFDENVVAGDFINWISPLVNDGVKSHILPETLTFRRVHTQNISQKYDRSDFLKILKSHIDARKKK